MQSEILGEQYKKREVFLFCFLNYGDTEGGALRALQESLSLLIFTCASGKALPEPNVSMARNHIVSYTYLVSLIHKTSLHTGVYI